MIRNILIGILLMLNFLLLYKILSQKSIETKEEQSNLNSAVITKEEFEENSIDSLVVKSWKEFESINYGFTRPSILFFFSKSNCQNCIEAAIDYLTHVKNKKFDILYIAVDITKKKRTNKLYCEI